MVRSFIQSPVNPCDYNVGLQGGISEVGPTTNATYAHVHCHLVKTRYDANKFIFHEA